MKTLDRILSFFEHTVNGTLLLIMSLVIFIQIICRHLGLPLDWSEETARFMFIWLIYIAVSQAVREHRHLSVDLLPLVLGPRGKVIIRIVSNMLCIVFFTLIFYYGMKVLGRLSMRPQRSQAMQVNMIYAYAAPFFGALLTTLRYLLDSVYAIKSLGMNGKQSGEEL